MKTYDGYFSTDFQRFIRFGKQILIMYITNWQGIFKNHKN